MQLKTINKLATSANNLNQIWKVPLKKPKPNKNPNPKPSIHYNS